MPEKTTFWPVLALIFALLAGSASAALAAPARTTAASRGELRELSAAARPRIVIHPRRHYPGPNAVRQCRFWLARENRSSGRVVTPQQRCVGSF